LRRFACGIEYDGYAYSGWQRQPGGVTVQGVVEDALSRVANQAIEVVGAGRTDAGVHARTQVALFDSDSARTQRQWLRGANSALPDDVALTWVRLVPDDFHARRSALWRRYHYRVIIRQVRSPLSRQQALLCRTPLDVGSMLAAGSYLLGERDFSAFRAAACQSTTPVRTLMSFGVTQKSDGLVFEFTANAFLHHMVRNMVGTLLNIGAGEREPGWCAQLLASRDRKQASATAQAQGLSLDAVAYSPEYGLPCV
jgi:tRNA pseudouridine38-40 synthase